MTTFVRITNVEIYKELREIKHGIDEIKGRIKLNRWISSTALTLSISLVILLASTKL